MKGFLALPLNALRLSENISRSTKQAVALMMLSILAVGAQAFTAPAAGAFGYDVYDIVVNQILGGPIGFIGGVFLIVWGASQVMKSWIITVLCVISGTILIRADTLVVSLGALVP